MLNSLFSSVLNQATSTTTSGITMGDFFTCTIVSLVLGAVIAFVFRFKNKTTKGFSITLALLPAIVQMVIMLVNGNLGTGVAVMGAFSLVRFRSVPGNARDICAIFLAMAAGLATGTGYLAIAAIFVAIMCVVNVIYVATPFAEDKAKKKILKITIPEGLDYSGVFDDLFKKYTNESELSSVRTTNMGSLFKLEYNIELKNPDDEKKFIDELRVRNGNLEIMCCKVAFNKDEL